MTIKAMQLTLQNLDIIAPAIGWTRSELNSYYETSSYYDKDEYVVVHYRDENVLDFESVDGETFAARYAFVTQPSTTELTEVTRL